MSRSVRDPDYRQGSHEHEAWQIREGADGRPYCAACGCHAQAIHDRTNEGHDDV